MNYQKFVRVKFRLAKRIERYFLNYLFSGSIPQCPGVIAFGKTLFECQKELESVLEGWLIVKIRHGDTLPVIDHLETGKTGFQCA